MILVMPERNVSLKASAQMTQRTDRGCLGVESQTTAATTARRESQQSCFEEQRVPLELENPDRLSKARVHRSFTTAP